MDFYLTEGGDIAVTAGGDIAITKDEWRDFAQQAYVRLMTTPPDFQLYPALGVNLESMIGMPQTPSTGNYGIKLIQDAFSHDGKFNGIPVNVNAIPVSLQSIRFDVYLTVGSRTEMLLSIEQNLGLEGDN